MTPAEFQNQLLEKLCIDPSFKAEDVESIECSSGTTWITLKNGEAFILILQKVYAPAPVNQDDLRELDEMYNEEEGEWEPPDPETRVFNAMQNGTDGG